MKQLHEFETLAQAQAEYTVEPKMVSGSQMKIFAVSNGLYGYLKKHANDLQIATYDEIKGGEFNFIEGHPSNVSSLIDAMIGYATTNEADTILVNPDGTAHSVVDGLIALKTASIAHANKKVYPHQATTQEQFDEAKAKHLKSGTTAVTTVKHDGILDVDGTGKMVNNRARRFKAVALLDAVTAFDTTITITLEEATADGVTKVEHPDKITIPVRAGSQPVIKFFPSVYTRWFRVKSATIGLIDTPFSLEIDGVQ